MAAAAADQQPLVGTAQRLSSPPGHWISSWLGCGISLDIFCVGCWCPCMLYAHNVAQLRGEPRFSLPTCLTYFSLPLAAELLATAAIFGLAGMAAPSALAGVRAAGLVLHRIALGAYASPTRGELRQAEGIPGSAAADWALWCLLPQCTLCQEAEQLADRQQRGTAQRSGSSGSSSSKGAAVQAPCQQLVESRKPARKEQKGLRSSAAYAAVPAVEPPHEQFMITVSA
ncbi:hypothetical protein ABPG75_006355 [Micractinium tetrahymenae]